MTIQWRPLTDSQWAAISPFLPLQRKRTHDLRRIINALLWQLRTGCQWRNLPFENLPWQTICYYFHRWKGDGTLEKLNAALNHADRLQTGREATPSLLCIDSQSVKLTPMGSEARGLDVHKAINGRKRQFIVDTQGRLWVACVHAANEADGPAAVPLIRHVLWRCGERLEKVLGDQAYNGVFAAELAQWSIEFEKASRPESARGFVPWLSGGWSSGRSLGLTSSGV